MQGQTIWMILWWNDRLWIPMDLAIFDFETPHHVVTDKAKAIEELERLKKTNDPRRLKLWEVHNYPSEAPK